MLGALAQTFGTEVAWHSGQIPQLWARQEEPDPAKEALDGHGGIRA